MAFLIRQSFQIESARYLPTLPKEHPCFRMHGHSFKIVLSLVGELDPEQGWLIDYDEIQKKMAPLLAQLDHRVLNEVDGLKNPTTEMLCRWLYEKAKLVLPTLTQVSVSETQNSECLYPVL